MSPALPSTACSPGKLHSRLGHLAISVRIHRKVQQPLCFLQAVGKRDSHTPSNRFCPHQASAEESSWDFPRVQVKQPHLHLSSSSSYSVHTEYSPPLGSPRVTTLATDNTEASCPSVLGLDEPEVEKMGGGGQVPVLQGLFACLLALRHHLVLGCCWPVPTGALLMSAGL